MDDQDLPPVPEPPPVPEVPEFEPPPVPSIPEAYEVLDDDPPTAPRFPAADVASDLDAVGGGASEELADKRGMSDLVPDVAVEAADSPPPPPPPGPAVDSDLGPSVAAAPAPPPPPGMAAAAPAPPPPPGMAPAPPPPPGPAPTDVGANAPPEPAFGPPPEIGTVPPPPAPPSAAPPPPAPPPPAPPLLSSASTGPLPDPSTASAAPPPPAPPPPAPPSGAPPPPAPPLLANAPTGPIPASAEPIPPSDIASGRPIDPFNFGPAAATIPSSTQKRAKTAVAAAATILEEGETVQSMVCGQYLAHDGAAVLTNRNIVFSNSRTFAPELDVIPLSTIQDVKGWAEKGRATLRIRGESGDFILGDISEVDGAQAFAAAVRLNL